MRIDHRFLNWGVFFILLGAIPLAVQAGWIDSSTVARSWQLWPLLIIGAGVGLLLRRTSFHFVGGLIVAATFGLMLGGLLAVGTNFGGFGRACGNDAGKAFPSQDGSIGSGVVELQFNCGDLTLGTVPGAGWTLTGSSESGDPPEIDRSADRLEIKSHQNSGIFGFGARQIWTATLPRDPTLDVDVQLNAGTGSLGFGGAHLGALTVQMNAGATVIDLSEAASIRLIDLQMNAGSAKVNLPNASLAGSFHANAGSLSFCVPQDVGLRITTADSIISSNNFAEQGLTKTGDTWQSANFASATNRITLTASANAGSISLNPREGCR